MLTVVLAHYSVHNTFVGSCVCSEVRHNEYTTRLCLQWNVLKKILDFSQEQKVIYLYRITSHTRITCYTNNGPLFVAGEQGHLLSRHA